jgi:hypothetical protein
VNPANPMPHGFIQMPQNLLPFIQQQVYWHQQMNQQQAQQQQQYYTTENNGQQLLMRHGANNVNRVLHWQRWRVSPMRHSPQTPGRQGENKPVNSIGRAETSILFHSNSRHTTNSDTLLQQQI